MRLRSSVEIETPGHSVLLEITDGEAVAAHASLEAPDLDALIARLAELRATLADQIPEEIDRGTKIQYLLDPAYLVPKNQPVGFRPLLLRTPGYGWLGFAFSDAAALALANQLTSNNAERHQPSEPGGVINWTHVPVQPAHPVLSVHAARVMEERKLKLAWLMSALFSPDEREPDPQDATLTRHYKTIEERDGRILRLVFRPTPEGLKIITAHFDRGRQR